MIDKPSEGLDKRFLLFYFCITDIKNGNNNKNKLTMKTKLITLTVLLLSAFAMKAQQNEIIIVDFEPDSCITDQYTRLWVDFDNDGNGDICLKMDYTSTGYWPEINSSVEWEITWLDDDDTDTIPNIDHWGHSYLWLDDEGQSRFAARKQIGNNYIFTWFEAYNYVTFNPFICHVCFDKYVYCTVPNYPLVWGQTELLAIKENDYSNTFASVHPNPTTGLVTIAGENLRQAEVLNMLGQQVLSVQGEGNELRIDMAALPAGVYFVNVTNDEGRKCVRKVVKE